MKQFLSAFLLIISTFSFGAVNIGDKANSFSLIGHDGKSYTLEQFKGQTVVLEWFNHGCPFVKKHYGSGNMQALQNEFKDKVVWLSVVSSAKGKQGHLPDSKAAAERYVASKMGARAILLDHDGSVGKKYGAVTTPQIVVIDKEGVLAYNGAIDSIPSANPGDINSATPLAKNAITAVLKGKKVAQAKNKPYGCSVKY